MAEDQARGTAVGAVPAARAPSCSDCRQVSCALRHLVAPGFAACANTRGQAHPPLPRGVWLAVFIRHPFVRHRLPTLAVLALSVGLAFRLGGAGLAPDAGFAAAALLALWWSAPRAGRPGWPGLLALAAAAAAAAGHGVWAVPAVALGFAAAWLPPGPALGVWALVATAIVARLAPAGLASAWPPLGATAVAAALGQWARVRRELRQREQQRWRALAARTEGAS